MALKPSPTSLTKVVTYTVSNAQRLTAAKDVANNIQFATAASYVPPGGLSGVITGQISGGFGGITESHTFNNSLEYTSTQATSTAGTALNLSLCYNQFSFGTGCSSSATNNNGSVTGVTNNVDSGRSQTLAYDPLSRISSATTQATSGVDCWGQNFSPDPLANLNTISSAQCSSGTLSVTVDGNNHINSSTTFAYDASGNMTQDGKGTGYSYSFDAENRLTKATGMTGGPYCYVYDGFGLRVAKKSGANSDCTGGTVTKLYWRSISGDALAETDGTGSVSNAAYNEYVFFAGRRVASRNGLGAIFYWFADHLGSTRTITTGSGTGQTPGQLCYDADFTPYGQEISFSARLQTTACSPNYKFTGYERDSETAYGQTDTGLDYAFARYYSSRLGRFLSTDPLGGAIGNLQSHNAYTYVQNNPLNSVDPLGLWCTGDGPGCSRGVGGGGDPFGDPLDLALADWLGSGSIPWYTVIDGHLWLYGPTNFITGYNPNYDPSEGYFDPFFISGTVTLFDLGSVTTNTSGGNSGFWGAFRTLMDAYWRRVPWSVTVTPTPGVITAAWIPGSNTWCLGGGFVAGVSAPDVPIGIGGGPLVYGDLENAKDVLKGLSVFYGVQPTPGIGWQHTFNTSGQLMGPTGGTWGGQIGFTVSGCKDFK